MSVSIRWLFVSWQALYGFGLKDIRFQGCLPAGICSFYQVGREAEVLLEFGALISL